jgi:hypothetical protein
MKNKKLFYQVKNILMRLEEIKTLLELYNNETILEKMIGILY